MSKNTAGGIMRITSAPSGQAPLQIREKWIGVEMSFIEVGTPKGSIRGVVKFDKVAKHEAFTVDQVVALTALRLKSPDTAHWWESMGYPVPDAQFTFNRDCAEIIG